MPQKHPGEAHQKPPYGAIACPSAGAAKSMCEWRKQGSKRYICGSFLLLMLHTFIYKHRSLQRKTYKLRICRHEIPTQQSLPCKQRQRMIRSPPQGQAHQTHKHGSTSRTRLRARRVNSSAQCSATSGMTPTSPKKRNGSCSNSTSSCLPFRAWDISARTWIRPTSTMHTCPE